jgi:hypothetical protein
MARMIGAALSDPQFLKALVPAPTRDFRIADGIAVLQEEEPVVVYIAGRYIGCPKFKVGLEHLKCSRGQVDIPVLLGLSPVFVSPEHPRLGDAQHTLSLIEVCHEQRDLFRRAKSGEEAQLIVVTDRITPIGAQLGN